MAPPAILTAEEIEAALTGIPAWKLAGGKLARTFVYSNFVEAFGFMTRVALLAERADHHPDWSNSYKTVEVSLMTHQVGGLTTKDTSLAKQIDAVA